MDSAKNMEKPFVTRQTRNIQSETQEIVPVPTLNEEEVK
jgi:hypothetical protein